MSRHITETEGEEFEPSSEPLKPFSSLPYGERIARIHSVFGNAGR